MNNCMFSSNKTEWETPQWLFDKLDNLYNFTIDVAADRTNHKCERYYTEVDDGLSKDWSNEVVWCNPPYGREIGKWVEKASKREATVVMLLPARTDTRWFHEYIYNKAVVVFIKGRLKFGNSKKSAPFPSMIVIFRRKREYLSFFSD